MKNLILIFLLLPTLVFAGDPARDCLIATANEQVGVRELTGKNDGPEVKKYLATCGLPEGYSWCGAMLNHVFIECGLPGTKGAAWSPSWFPDSKVIYTAGTSNYQVPQGGDVFGIYFASKKRIAHVGMVILWSARYVTTVEGNTNGAGSRNGDGVYSKIRPIRQISMVADHLS